MTFPLKKSCMAIVFALIPVCILLSGCLGLGYQVGSKTLFGQDVKTVYVPMFESDVVQRDVAERLTEAVCKRIESRSSYKVVGRTSADSVLKGRITSRTTMTTITDQWADSRQKNGVVTVQVQWVDRRDRDLRQFDAIPWNDGSGNIAASDYLVPEYGQSSVTLEQAQFNKIADQIVGMMEIPW